MSPIRKAILPLFLLLLTPQLFAAQVGNLEGQDLQQMERRFEARKYQNFSFGPATLINMNSDGIAYQFSYGRLWEMHPHFGAVLRTDWTMDFDDYVGFWNFALGGRFFFFTSDISPYLQADLGLGVANDFGFQLGAAVGMVFFRTSSVNLVIEPNIQWLIADNNPIAMGLKLGINY